MFTIGIVIAFGIIIIAATWLANKYNKPLIPILVMLVAIAAMWIYFHNWLFAAMGLLLWAFTTMFLAAKKLLKVFLGLMVLVIFLGGLWLTTSLPSYYDRIIGNWPTAQKADKPKVGDSKCVEAIVVDTQKHGDKVLLDLNDGDPFDYSFTMVHPDLPMGPNTLAVLTDPMYSFDVVHPVMFFTSYRLRGTFDQALCSAQKLAGNSALAYVYVGKEATPKGWSTISTKGWWTELTLKQYSEKAITIGVDSLPFQLSTTDKNRDLVSIDVLHGQLWKPIPEKDEKILIVHPQVGEGYTLTAPFGWQGTYWTIADGKPELVQARIIQTTKEVIERDELSLNEVTLLYCGATVPTTELTIGEETLNWVTNLEGWTCEVTKK